MFVWLLCFHIWVKQDKIMFIKKCLNTPPQKKKQKSKQTTKHNNNNDNNNHNLLLPALLNINYGKNIWLFKLTLHICSSKLSLKLINTTHV